GVVPSSLPSSLPSLLSSPPPPPPTPTLFPYTTLFRSSPTSCLVPFPTAFRGALRRRGGGALAARKRPPPVSRWGSCSRWSRRERSEEHTSELQSRFDLVCRLLLEKKKST